LMLKEILSMKLLPQNSHPNVLQGAAEKRTIAKQSIQTLYLSKYSVLIVYCLGDSCFIIDCFSAALCIFTF
jgi:hypothetical protein